MPRTNIDATNNTEESERILALTYSKSSTVGELTEGIETLRKFGRNIGDNQSLKEAVEYVLDLYGKKIRDFENWEEIDKFLNTLPEEETLKEVEEDLKNGSREVVAETKLESKSLNSKELEALLEVYEEHNKEGLERTANEAAKNPLLKQYKTQDLLQQLAKIYKLDTEKRNEGKPVEKAIEETKVELVTEARIVDQGIEPEKAKELTKVILIKTEKEIAVTRNEVRAILNSQDNEVITKETARGEFGETAGKNKMTKTKIFEDEAIGTVLDIAREVTYEKKIDEQIEVITEAFVKKIETIKTAAEIDNKQKEVIKKTIAVELKKSIVNEELVNKPAIITKAMAVARIEDQVPVALAVDESVAAVETFVENHEPMVNTVRQQEQFDSIWNSFLKNNPTITPEQRVFAREYAKTIATLPPSGLENFQKEAVEHAVGTERADHTKVTRTQAEMGWSDLNQGLRLAKAGNTALNKLDRLKTKLDSLGVHIPVDNKYLRPVDTLVGLAKKDPHLATVIEAVSKKITFYNNFYNGLGYKVFAKVGGEKAVTWLATKIGGDAGLSLAKQGLEIIAQKGFSEGIKNILIQVATKAGITVTTAATTATVEGAATLTGVLAGVSNPVGWVITAAIIAIQAAVSVIKKIQGTIKNITTALNIELVDTKAWMEDQFGKVGAGVVTITSGFMALVGGLGAALVIPFLVPVVVFLFVGMAGFQMFSGGQVSSIKPPEGMGGGRCVLKSDSNPNNGSNDEVNCNPNVSDKTAGRLDKNSYESKVNAWDTRGGTNAAKKCFNDAVCRANTAGINPKIVLTIWLSESAASNYTAPRTGLDFGINVPSVAPPKNFNKQIQAFFNQPSAMLGQCGSQHSGTQTEKFIATYVRTEAGACPDPQSGEGKKYLDYIRGMYQYLFGEDLPSSPFVDKQSGDCSLDFDGGSNTNTTEITDQNGGVWICDNTSSAGVGGSAASSLAGMNGGQVDGECSTAGAAIGPTYEQCHGPWAGVRFPSGSGTVCSAGCGPTSASMVVSRKDGSCTPDQMVINNPNCAGDAYAGITNGGSGIDQNVNAINHAYPGSTHAVGCSTPQEIADFICKGNKLVEVLADFFIDSAGHYGGHYFLAVGVSNGQIVVKDPYWENDHHFDGKVQAGSIAKIYSCILVDANQIK